MFAFAKNTNFTALMFPMTRVSSEVNKLAQQVINEQFRLSIRLKLYVCRGAAFFKSVTSRC